MAVYKLRAEHHRVDEQQTPLWHVTAHEPAAARARGAPATGTAERPAAGLTPGDSRLPSMMPVW
jgi:hypothetical protein